MNTEHEHEQSVSNVENHDSTFVRPIHRLVDKDAPCLVTRLTGVWVASVLQYICLHCCEICSVLRGFIRCVELGITVTLTFQHFLCVFYSKGVNTTTNMYS